jgi:hypothetical protein
MEITRKNLMIVAFCAVAGLATGAVAPNVARATTTRAHVAGKGENQCFKGGPGTSPLERCPICEDVCLGANYECCALAQ